MIAAVRSQIGKPYDKTGALGLGLHRDWQEDDAWWCSELIPWAAQQADDHGLCQLRNTELPAAFVDAIRLHCGYWRTSK